MPKKTRRKIGRPTKYDPKYCEMLIGHMAEGLSFESFAGIVETTRETLYNWANANDDFLHAKKIGTEKSKIFWEKIGTDLATGKIQGNTAAWIFNMKNRFKGDWKDRHDIEVTNIQPSVIERSNGDQVILDVKPVKQIEDKK